MAGDCFVGGAITGGDLLDPSFCRIWSKCHYIIAADGGGYFITSLANISGSEVRKPLSGTPHSV